MIAPLVASDRNRVLLEQAARVSALAVAQSLDPVSQHPLLRMDPRAATRMLFRRLSEVSVAGGGQPVSWAGPLRDLDAALALLTVEVTRVEAELAELAESGAPDWVPEAFAEGIYVDFVRAFNDQDAAWVAGVGVVAVDALFGSDATADAYWGATTAFDPTALTEHGYDYTGTMNGEPAAFIGALRDMAAAGATLAWGFRGSGVGAFFGVSEDQASVVQVEASMRDLNSYSNNNELVDLAQAMNADAAPDPSYTRNSLAVTLVSDRLDAAMNGEFSGTAALAETDIIPGSPLVAFLIDSNAFALRYVGARAPLAYGDGSALRALSDTGVENTAPHDLVFEWREDVAPGGIATQANLTNDPGGLQPIMQNVIASDDEGNPVVLTVVDDETGALSVEFTGFGFDWTVFWSIGPTPPDVGIYGFTLRLTDPGGLYVEQEFEIEVTAE